MPRRQIRHPDHERRRSLGWIAVWWIETFVKHGRGGAKGMDVRYGDEYTSFIVDCYAHDARGRRFYESAFFSRPKGTDKSGVAAALVLFEAFGPARFAGWAKGGETYEFLGQVYEYEPGEPMGKTVHEPMIRILATEEGQPLALDTPVRTVDGWSTVGALQVGDHVFGSDGRPVRVARTTRVFHDLDCFEVVFSDGERITASGSHLWTAERARLSDAKKEVVTVTTEQMSKDFYSRTRGNRYRIPVTPAFEAPERDLPVDPYFLGLWLGDGKKADAAIAYDMLDHEWVEAWATGLCEDGESAVFSNVEGCGMVRFRRHDRREDDRTMRAKLRSIGVLDEKHIPESYLAGSIDQRMAVLQGLMDSDGTIDSAKGRAIFTNADRRIIDGIEELLTGLGYKWDERFDASVQAWRVGFQPTSDRPVNRLPRKVARHRPRSSNPRSEYRYVVDVRPVSSVPVKCIGIDNEDHLFAAGKRMVLTHNTGNTYDSVYYNLTNEDCPLYQLQAYGLDVGQTRVKIHTGGEIVPSTTGSASKDGGLETFAVFDETHLYVTQSLRDMYTTVTRNLQKRRKEGTWFIETTTMYQPGQESVAEETYRFADDIDAGKARNKTLLFDHRWADVPSLYPMPVVEDGVERQETEEEYLKRLEASFRESFGDAIAWNDIEGLMNGLFDPRNSPAATQRYFFNALSSADDAWITKHEWEAIGLKRHLADCRATGKTPEWIGLDPGDTITLGFDGGRTNDATALIACRVRDGLIVPIRIWEAPDTAEADGWAIDAQEVDGVVQKTHKKYRVVGFFADPPFWQEYVASWENRYGDSYLVKKTSEKPIQWWTSSSNEMAKALENAHTAIASRTVRHTDHKVLTKHFLNARVRERSFGYLIFKDRPKSPNKIDAAMAAVLAIAARAEYLRIYKDEPAALPFRVR